MAYQPRGLYFEEFEIGKCYESMGRTITEADVVNFAGLSGDFNPLHVDEEFGKANMFGTRIAHGALGLIIATGMSNLMGVYEGTALAVMELTARYTAPLMIGDTVHLEMTPTEAIPKKGKGILKVSSKLINQNGVVVLDSPWTVLMKLKPE